MAKLAHAVSTSQTTNLSPAPSQRSGRNNNPRCELTAYSRWSQPQECLPGRLHSRRPRQCLQSCPAFHKESPGTCLTFGDQTVDVASTPVKLTLKVKPPLDLRRHLDARDMVW